MSSTGRLLGNAIELDVGRNDDLDTDSIVDCKCRVDLVLRSSGGEEGSHRQGRRDAGAFLEVEKRGYRRLGPRLSGPEELARSGVEVEVPRDPQSEIEALLSLGEGPYLEYKLMLPSNKLEEKRKVLKTVAAFANAAGGSIVFGIDPDEVTVAGLDEVSPQDVRDRLGNLIRGNVVPPDPVFDVRWATVNGRLVVVLDVEPSEGRPYGVRFQDKPVEFYVRRGASSYPATQEEVRLLAKADNTRMSGGSAWGPPRG